MKSLSGDFEAGLRNFTENSMINFLKSSRYQTGEGRPRTG